MPFTPFHLGPALLIGIILFPFIDLFVILIASVIIDIEPLYIVITRSRAPLHGILHTYLMATVVSLILSLIMYPLKRYYLKLLRIFGLKQETSFAKILISSLIGTYSHVFLDSFVYSEIKPFYPYSGNPFLHVLSITAVYGICVVSFIIGLIIYIIRILYKRE